MNEILRRRRALMGAQGGASDVLYELKNQSVAGDGHFDTGVPFFGLDFAGSILLDISMLENPAGATSLNRLYRLLEIKDSVNTGHLLYVGKNKRAATDICCSMSNDTATSIGIPCGVYRYKICLTHEANDNTVNIWSNADGGTVAQYSHTHIHNEQNDHYDHLTIGGNTETTALPQSTIHLARVYNRILSADEINAFFA